MTVSANKRLGLLVYHHPYQNRVARSDVDIALAAAALDLEVHIYFSGRSILQLAEQKNISEALLPGGYRAWAALPDFGEAKLFAERQWMDYCDSKQIRLLMDVEVIAGAGMKLAWRRSDHVMVL